MVKTVQMGQILPKDYYLIKKYKEDQKKLNEYWNGIDYRKYMNRIYDRLDLLRQLHDIYPKIELQSEAIGGWRTKLYSFDEFEHSAELYAPAVHYRILPNEIVFEIDADDIKEANKEAMEVTKHLVLMGAKPFVGFSGNRGYHIHVLIAPPDGDVVNFVNAIACRQFTLKIYEVLKELIGIDHLDEGVMYAKNHTIRSFYSLNMKSMRWKKPVFGEEYSVWVIPKNLWIRAFDELQAERIESELLRELSEFEQPIRVSKGNGKKYKWIEWLIEHPEKVTDGRERLLWLAIVPYLRLQGYDRDKIEEICKRWIEKSGAEWKSKYWCKVRQMISHCKRYERETGKKWMPISLEKLLEHFKDLEFLKKGVNDG